MRTSDIVEKLRSLEGRRWLWTTIRTRVWSSRESVCLSRDLQVPHPQMHAAVPLAVRLLRPDDDLVMLADLPELSPTERKRRADQRWLLTQELPAPWIALDPDGVVCFMTWMLFADQNERIRKIWRGALPQLRPDQVLVEGLFSAESHRGMGIMPAAVYLITDALVKESDVRYGVGFILAGNKSSLRGGDKAGWAPYLVREEQWRLFWRRVRFVPAPGAGAR